MPTMARTLPLPSRKAPVLSLRNTPSPLVLLQLEHNKRIFQRVAAMWCQKFRLSLQATTCIARMRRAEIQICKVLPLRTIALEARLCRQTVGTSPPPSSSARTCYPRASSSAPYNSASRSSLNKATWHRGISVLVLEFLHRCNNKTS